MITFILIIGIVLLLPLLATIIDEIVAWIYRNR